MHKIHFLGVAGSDAVLNQIRGTGGILMQLDKFQIHIDPGPGALLQCKHNGISAFHTNLILVSHNHLSHCNDLNIMIDAMTYQGLDTKGVVIGDESVIHGTALEKPIINKRQNGFVEQVLSLNPGKEVSIGNIKIKALKTNHKCETGLGFRIETEDYIYSYTGDTGYFPGLAEQHKDVDVLIVNNVYPFGKDSKENLNSNNSTRLINEVRPRLVMLTHFGKEIIKGDAIYDARKIQQETNIRVLAAKDGLVLDPSEYIDRRKKLKVSDYRNAY